jgi:hypothetical protein
MKCKYCNGTGEALPKTDKAKTIVALRKRGLSLRQIGKEVGINSASHVKYYVDKFLGA